MAAERRFFGPALAVLGLALAVPFFLVDVPPVQDYPNHLARLFVLANPGDPALAAIYAPRWAILPNLAIDIVGPALIGLFPVHAAGRLLLAGALFLPLVGVLAYARAAFGRWTGWSLAAGLAGYNAILILGFMNFLYGVGLALLAAAYWTATRERRPALAVAGGALASAAVFFCHVFGVAFLALLLGADELARLWRRFRAGDLTAPAIAASAAAVVLAIAPAIALYFASPFSAAAGATLFDPLERKLVEAFVPFLAYSQPIAVACGLAVIATMLLLRTRFTVHPPAAIAFTLLLLAYVVAPGTLKGGSFVDTRLPLLLVLVAFAGFRPAFTQVEGRVVSALMAALVAVRIGSVAIAWHEHNADLAGLRAAIAAVPPGARVLVAAATVDPDPVGEPAARAIPNISRTDRHLAALLVIERRAFWPLLFADPRQQPLAVLPPYDRIAFPLGEPPEAEALMRPPTPRDLAIAPYLRDWPANFDYVLVMEDGKPGRFAALLPERLDPVAANPVAALFAVHR